MSSITFIFRQPPHIYSSGREGLDALLAASAFSEDIQVVFLGEGVSNLLIQQQPSVILSRDYISMFKLFELYEIENVYVCQHSLERLGLKDAELVIDAQRSCADDISEVLRNSNKVLTF
ncbi:sulfurtransferase complex subunit TusC [Vibrio quintilis]|uniref:Protein TusC homolog n=1 Tax=Vibrio quintilis TaxID=1117707 RepID=A0A1M7YR44_9VIBR|nr:sulfurtransferase complex subunit TusC [Vibrio quintilis]SHO55045.1 Intracellular sulfur oxidation protein DsrF [Vibrio quintilis]